MNIQMKHARWLLAFSVLLFGVLATNWTSIKWIIITLCIYSIPLLFQFSHSKLRQIYSIWFGVFLILQTLVPVYLDDGYRALIPDLNYQIDVRGNGMPGIQGIQTFSTDNMGFRVTKIINYQNKPVSNYRIFAIGASTTKQTWIDDHKTWTHILQSNLEKHLGNKEVEVINTGVSGLRARNHLATLDEIVAYQPDLIILLLGINDWNKHITDHFRPPTNSISKIYNIISYQESILGESLIKLYDLIFKNTAVPENKKFKVTHGEYYTDQNDSLSRPDKRSFKPLDVSEDYKFYMNKIAATCHKHKIPCMFVTQPSGYSIDAKEEYKKRFWMTPAERNYTLNIESLQNVSSLYNKYLLTYAKNNKFSACDIASKIAPSISFMYDDCHFNINGARKVGELITSCVNETAR